MLLEIAGRRGGYYSLVTKRIAGLVSFARAAIEVVKCALVQKLPQQKLPDDSAVCVSRERLEADGNANKERGDYQVCRLS